MATRCNILVSKTQDYGPGNPNNGLRYAQYYRHWDGYPTGTGLDLALKLLELTRKASPDELRGVYEMTSELRSILTLDYEGEGTGHQDSYNLHGDIEWLYHIDLDNGLTLTAYDIGIGNDPDSWRSRPAHQLLRVRAMEHPAGSGKQYWQLVSLRVGA